MNTRCKMRLEAVIPKLHGGMKAIFRCEYDQKIAEDVSFSKYTPNGLAEFDIDNPDVIQNLVIGQSYYFDIHPVPALAPDQE